MMAGMTRLQAALLLITFASLCSQTVSMVVNRHQSSSKTPSICSSKRRALLFFGAASTFLVVPPPAQAIQERNELLCGTGFFTNIGQWYCTDLGNIADEGNPGELSKQQDKTADSLMDKLGLSDASSTDTESNDKKSNAEKETQNKQ
jgi:hypothetical protein